MAEVVPTDGVNDGLTDRERITDVLVRYASGIDARDWTLLARCFTDGCTLDYGEIGRWHGPDEVVTFMRRAHSGPSLHRLSNLAVEVDGDRATARSYVDAVVTGPGGWGGAHSLGFYDDRLVRTPDGWRIDTRRYTDVRLTLLGRLRVVPSAWASRVAARATRRLMR